MISETMTILRCTDIIAFKLDCVAHELYAISSRNWYETYMAAINTKALGNVPRAETSYT